MIDIDEVMKIPNTEENEYIRALIRELYKKFHEIPDGLGVNMCDVINWAKKIPV